MATIPCIICNKDNYKNIIETLNSFGYICSRCLSTDIDKYNLLIINVDGFLGTINIIENTEVNISNYNRELYSDINKFFERANYLKKYINLM